MLTRKKSIVSCFVIGALLCTLNSGGTNRSMAAKDALAVAAAHAERDFPAGTQDIRKTSREENTREIVKASIKSTGAGNDHASEELAVVRIAGASVKSGAASLTAAGGQSEKTAVQSESEVRETELPVVQSSEEATEVKETQIQPETAAAAIAPELENKVITTVDTYQNVRKDPSEDAEIIGRLEGGSAGDILETKDGWTRISSGGVEGWVHNEYVVSGEAAQSYAEGSLEQVATVTDEGVRVRAGASVDSTWIGVVNAGEVYTIVPEETEGETEASEEAVSVSEQVQPEEEKTEEPALQSGEAQTEPVAAEPQAVQEQSASGEVPEEAQWVRIRYDGEDGYTEGYVCADYVTTAFALGQAKSMEEIRAEEEAKAQAEREAKAAQAAKAEKESASEKAAAPAAAAEADSGWTALGEFKITAYCGGACCNGKWAGTTASGAAPAEGRTIAVAPWIIPYGTQVKIEGFDNIYVAEDTGGFANRNPYQIDLFVGEHSHAGSWGVRYRQVWVKR